MKIAAVPRVNQHHADRRSNWLPDRRPLSAGFILSAAALFRTTSHARVLESEWSIALGRDELVWSPLAKGMLTGRYRKGQALPESLRAKVFPKQMFDERNLEVVERLIPIADPMPTCEDLTVFNERLGDEALSEILLDRSLATQYRTARRSSHASGAQILSKAALQQIRPAPSSEQAQQSDIP